MTRDEMVTRKARIDARLAELKLRLKDWRREAASSGRFRPVEEYTDLEAEIARYGQRSQKIQTALGDLRRADKRGSNAWFEAAAKELLPGGVFFEIHERARELRLASLQQAGFMDQTQA